MNTIINKIMNRDAMILFLGFFTTFLFLSFGSALLILLLPFLLLLLGLLKLYEMNEKH